MKGWGREERKECGTSREDSEFYSSDYEGVG